MAKSRGGEGESSADDISMRLAHASSVKERRDIFVQHLEEHADDFEQECARVSQLLEKGDREEFIEYATRIVPERARARVSAIQAGK